MMEKSHNPVDFDFKKLPKAAQIFFDGIKSDLQRISHVADEHPDEPESQIITETKSRYLPDTLKAFYKLPVSARSNIALHGDKNGEQILTEQLQKIAWATRTATDSLIKRTGSDLIVNGRFLNEKFPQSVLQKPYDIVTKPDNIIEEDIEKTSVIVADQENFSVGKNMKLMIFATVFTLFYFLIILSCVERSTKHALVSADKLFLTDIATASEVYFADRNYYPKTINDLILIDGSQYIPGEYNSKIIRLKEYTFDRIDKNSTYIIRSPEKYESKDLENLQKFNTEKPNISDKSQNSDGYSSPIQIVNQKNGKNEIIMYNTDSKACGLNECHHIAFTSEQGIVGLP